MKKFFSLLYWITVTIFMSFVYSSILKSYPYALLLSVMFLPGALFAKYFIPKINFENKIKGVIHFICVLIGSVYIVSVGIAFAYWYIFKYETLAIPPIIVNPFLIWMLLILFIGAEIVTEKYLFKEKPDKKVIIEFISDRRRVRIAPDEIIIVESRDNEVFIFTVTGKTYRTKMRISKWEELLGSGFVRVHRSFLVNSEFIEKFNHSSVIVAGREIEISRKYRENFF